MTIIPRTATLALCTALLPAMLQAQPARLPGTMTPAGNPAALVASDSALAHLARDKGANAALGLNADDAGVLFAPARTPARTWLKSHDAAAQFVNRQTASVWVACDGSAGISAGLWGRDGAAAGWFAVVWKRQKKGGYKWLLADAAPLAPLPRSSDFITGKVAECPSRLARADGDGPPPKKPAVVMLPPLPAAIPAPIAGGDSVDGRSDDGSLVWRSTVAPDGARHLIAWTFHDGAMQAVLDRATPAPVR
ncbi:hypothetical protein [Novosphingobium sp.]|uniref:hypothetical protein n=1 Tax=Novosphingobium sp. TaxID=1874826 RepID=UPI0033408D3B